LRLIACSNSVNLFQLIDSKTLVVIYEQQMEYAFDIYLSADVVMIQKKNSDWKFLIRLSEGSNIKNLVGNFV
jgi:hypothetical protein